MDYFQRVRNIFINALSPLLLVATHFTLLNVSVTVIHTSTYTGQAIFGKKTTLICHEFAGDTCDI